MARNDPRLLEKVAVVTGAGDGLGRALALGLCTKGLRVVGLSRSAEGLAKTAELAGTTFTPMQVDVSDFAAVKTAFARITLEHGGPGLLINNAAVYPRRDLLEETPGSFMQTVNVNLGGLMACSHAALQTMLRDGFGRIVNVATFADLHPLPASAAYSISKGAARIYTRALVADIGDRFPDIVVNDWMPGMLATRMGIPDGLTPEESARWGVEMALWHDPALTGSTFEMGAEVLPPRGLKGKVKDLMLLRRQKPRLL